MNTTIGELEHEMGASIADCDLFSGTLAIYRLSTTLLNELPADAEKRTPAYHFAVDTFVHEAHDALTAIIQLHGAFRMMMEIGSKDKPGHIQPPAQ